MPGTYPEPEPFPPLPDPLPPPVPPSPSPVPPVPQVKAVKNPICLVPGAQPRQHSRVEGDPLVVIAE
jgi:hypothetical protein